MPIDDLFNYSQLQQQADQAYRNSDRGFIDSLFSPVSTGGRNPNPFVHGPNAKTAYESRKLGKRVYAPAAGAIAAQGALLDPTLKLAGATAAGYGDIYRTEAGKASSAYDEQNPDLAALMHSLTSDATDLVQHGGETPYEDRLVQQDIRAGQAARGLGQGQGDALAELLGLDRAREGRRMARGNYGAGILNQGENYYQDSLKALFNMGGIQAPDVGTGTSDLLSYGANDMMQRRNMHAANLAGKRELYGAGIKAAGSVVGGVIAACWVAEELYGKDDERTHLARAWVLTHDSPFLRAYRKHGRTWAKWLAAHPKAKPMVKPIWDAMWISQMRNAECEVRS